MQDAVSHVNVKSFRRRRLFHGMKDKFIIRGEFMHSDEYI